MFLLRRTALLVRASHPGIKIKPKTFSSRAAIRPDVFNRASLACTGVFSQDALMMLGRKIWSWGGNSLPGVQKSRRSLNRLSGLSRELDDYDDDDDHDRYFSQTS